ncbi:MAG: bifunctional adenosylcobinamide kinase/adenosylcobinamide-phosphate guanylyltransferase [Bilophila sp.]
MKTADLTLDLGGTRSGKSEQAETRVHRLADGPVLYVATAQAGDAAMSERIRRHRARRPDTWQTLECPLHVAESLSEALSGLPSAVGTPTVLLDCVTLWVSNILFSLPDPERPPRFEREVRTQIEALIRLARTSPCRFVLVLRRNRTGRYQSHAPWPHLYADGLGWPTASLRTPPKRFSRHRRARPASGTRRASRPNRRPVTSLSLAPTRNGTPCAPPPHQSNVFEEDGGGLEGGRETFSRKFPLPPANHSFSPPFTPPPAASPRRSRQRGRRPAHVLRAFSTA